MRKERAEGKKDHINKNRKKGNAECSKKTKISNIPHQQLLLQDHGKGEGNSQSGACTHSLEQ
jgi:hypothetical protein